MTSVKSWFIVLIIQTRLHLRQNIRNNVSGGELQNSPPHIHILTLFLKDLIKKAGYIVLRCFHWRMSCTWAVFNLISHSFSKILLQKNAKFRENGQKAQHFWDKLWSTGLENHLMRTFIYFYLCVSIMETHLLLYDTKLSVLTKRNQIMKNCE